jgi:hypothetical protein
MLRTDTLPLPEPQLRDDLTTGSSERVKRPIAGRPIEFDAKIRREDFSRN